MRKLSCSAVGSREDPGWFAVGGGWFLNELGTSNECFAAADGLADDG